jgi:8-oxo-dGTP pyrophosphatase MutT (NUDIX family)
MIPKPSTEGQLQYLRNNTDYRAGIILIYHDLKTGEKTTLLVNAFKKWGFPKGYAEQICAKCGMIWEKNTCVQKMGYCNHLYRQESIWECAVRELREEAGVDLTNLDQDEYDVLYYQSVIGKKAPSMSCTYIVVEIKFKPGVTIDPVEIDNFKWLRIDRLAEEIVPNFRKYNMGVRRISPLLPCLYKLLSIFQVSIQNRNNVQAQVAKPDSTIIGQAKQDSMSIESKRKSKTESKRELTKRRPIYNIWSNQLNTNDLVQYGILSLTT